MDEMQRDMLEEWRQLCANARENATDQERAFIDAVEKRGCFFMTAKEAERLQEIADR